MQKETYLILRVTQTGRESYDAPISYENLRGDKGAKGAAPLQYQVETQDLDQQDYHEARNDPQVEEIARPMPLRLIAPVAAPSFDQAHDAPFDQAHGAPPAASHLYGATWGVHVTGALQSPYVGRNVTVAVLDTGIDAGHEAFQGLELLQKDFTGEGDGDQDGHGTHVAGTIFGQTGPGPRYAVAPGVRRALIGKVLGRARSASTKELVDAIQWAVDEGAQVINMSLGFDFPGLVRWWVKRDMEIDLATSKALAQYRDNLRFFDKLVDLLRARAAHAPSALVVAAAGNESKRAVRADYVIETAPPAAADGVLSVAALGSAGPPHEALAVAPFSNVRADVAAPGVGVYSAQKGGGYTYLSGTSMASPHVAGLAALWAERQIEYGGAVNVGQLEAELRGQASRQRLPGANSLDVGAGLVTAPQPTTHNIRHQSPYRGRS